MNAKTISIQNALQKATNGWGMYEHFVPFVEKYLEACKEYPDAVIEVSR